MRIERSGAMVTAVLLLSLGPARADWVDPPAIVEEPEREARPGELERLAAHEAEMRASGRLADLDNLSDLVERYGRIGAGNSAGRLCRQALTDVSRERGERFPGLMRACSRWS